MALDAIAFLNVRSVECCERAHGQKVKNKKVLGIMIKPDLHMQWPQNLFSHGQTSADQHQMQATAAWLEHKRVTFGATTT